MGGVEHTHARGGEIGLGIVGKKTLKTLPLPLPASFMERRAKLKKERKELSEQRAAPEMHPSGVNGHGAQNVPAVPENEPVVLTKANRRTLKRRKNRRKAHQNAKLMNSLQEEQKINDVIEGLLEELEKEGASGEEEEEEPKEEPSGVHDDWLCPITMELMVDPVIAADGHTYERYAIEDWLAKNGTSPVTQMILPHDCVAPNIKMKLFLMRRARMLS